MAEFLNQPVVAVDPVYAQGLDALGHPVHPRRRSAGYDHAKAMGLASPQAFECVQAVSNYLERDKPYEAMEAGMRYLDLTGTYRLMAVLLTAEVTPC